MLLPVGCPLSPRVWWAVDASERRPYLVTRFPRAISEAGSDHGGLERRVAAWTYSLGSSRHGNVATNLGSAKNTGSAQPAVPLLSFVSGMARGHAPRGVLPGPLAGGKPGTRSGQPVDPELRRARLPRAQPGVGDGAGQARRAVLRQRRRGARIRRRHLAQAAGARHDVRARVGLRPGERRGVRRRGGPARFSETRPGRRTDLRFAAGQTVARGAGLPGHPAGVRHGGGGNRVRRGGAGDGLAGGRVRGAEGGEHVAAAQLRRGRSILSARAREGPAAVEGR